MSLLSPSLQAFWAVSEKGTVQDAARKIGLTQTGVTQRIRSLEKQLKTTLFIRSRKGMRLTSEGENLLQYVRQCLESEGLTLSKIHKAALEAVVEFRISGPSSVMRSRVIPGLTPVLKSFPNLKVGFDLSDTESNTEKLKLGLSQVALLEHHEVSREMDSKIIRPERYKLYVSPNWRKRSLADIIKQETIIDFDKNDRMTFQYLEKYKLKSSALKDRHFANNTDALRSLITSGVGYSVLSEDYARPYIKANELFDICPDQFFDFKLALAWYPRPEMPGYFKAILQTLK